MPIKAILFDVDGLMFETEIIAQRMMIEVATEHGLIIPEGYFEAITGSNVQGILQRFPEVTPILEEMKTKRFDLTFWKNIQKDCLNKEGLLDLYHFLTNHAYQIAICSSSPREYVEAVLSTVSIPIQYDVIVCGDMVEKVKPDPQIFLLASEALGVEPEACLVLEDSKNGILAACRAHMHHCFIQDTIEKDAELQNCIEYECKNLREVIGLLEQ